MRRIILLLSLIAIAATVPQAASAAVAFDDVLQLRHQGPTGLPQIAASVTAAQLDSDDRVDIVVGAESEVRVFEAHPERGLMRAQKPIFRSSFDEIGQVIVAQIDSDGSPDLAVTVGAFSGASLTVLRSNGDGTFEKSTPDGIDETARSVAAGDLNGDGNTDLAVAVIDGVQVLAGDGAGGFAEPTLALDVPNAAAVEIADLDLDSDADLAAVDRYGEAVAGLGDGSGSFAQQPAVRFSKTNRSFVDSLEAGDLTGDRIPELVAGNPGGVSDTGGTFVLIGDGTGGFAAQPAAPQPILPPGIRSPDGIRLADLNGDGDLDLVSAQEDLTAGSFSVSLGDGSGEFNAPVSFGAHMGPSGLAVADIGGDDRLDVVGANYYDGLSVSAYIAGGKRTTCDGRAAGFVGQEMEQIQAPADRPRVNDYTYDYKDASADVVSLAAGADIARQGGGDDAVCGGSGTDYLGGGKGDDVLIGGDGSDTLNGGPGRDLCVAGGGRTLVKNCERVR